MVDVRRLIVLLRLLQDSSNGSRASWRRRFHSAPGTPGGKKAPTTWRTLLAVSFAVATAAAQNQPARLQPLETVTRQISGTETHDYIIALKTNQALNVVVNQLGVNLVVVVSGPDGKVITEMDNLAGQNGPESVWIVSAAAGDHAVKVRPMRPGRAGGYELRVATLRDATADDRKRVELQRTLLTASRHLASSSPGNRESLAAVLQPLKGAAAATRSLGDVNLARMAGTVLVRLDPKSAMDIFGIASLPGTTPLYYSSGYEERAKSMLVRLTPAVEFFESKLRVTPTIHFAILARDDWTQITSAPRYGIPWMTASSHSAVTPAAALVCMPATSEMSIPDGLQPDAVARLRATGLTMEEGLRLTGDGRMFHELGHVYVDAYGIAVRNRWLQEFLGNFMWAAYETERSPDPRARVFHEVWMERQRQRKQQYTSLEDFDTGQRTAAAVDERGGNYAWYQAQFLKRAEAVYKAHGLAFLEKVKEAFPPTPKPLPTEVTLQRLEKFAPGFIEWAASLAAAHVPSGSTR